MLYIIFDTIPEEEASALFKKPILENPDGEFLILVEECGFEISANPYFQKILKYIDNADVPMPNVIRDIPTGLTSDIFKVSTGVKTLWLTAIGENYTFLSEWYGPNCLQELLDISKHRDIYVYDDSRMFGLANVKDLKGKFTDFMTGAVYELDGYNTTYELIKLDYY